MINRIVISLEFDPPEDEIDVLMEDEDDELA